MLRFLFRVILLIVTLVGIGLAFVMPWAAERSGAETGRWRVYGQEAGFSDVATLVSGEEMPSVVLEIYTQGPLPSIPGAILTVTASVDAATVLAQAVDVDGISPSVVNPQRGEHLYTRDLGPLPAAAKGELRFHFAPGDAGTAGLMEVDLVLTTKAAADPRLLPVGYVLLVVGFVGLVTSFRKRRPVVTIDPAPPRWGRG
jgi:hypothetical protein